MADSDEDDGFVDDDLDALITQDFFELQQTATRSAPPRGQPARPTQLVQELSQLNVKATTSRSPWGIKHSYNQPQAETYAEKLSSDYGDLDDEVLDAGLLDAPREPLAGRSINPVGPGVIGERTQREQWRQQHYSGPLPPLTVNDLQPLPHDQPGLVGLLQDPSRAVHGIDQDNEAEMLDVSDAWEAPESVVAKGTDTVVTLQAKVAELLSERETLRKAAQSANDQSLAKAGEISIVRANHLKAQREHEKQLKELQKQHTESAVKQQADIEHARAEREKLVAEKRYLLHDLTVEGERTKQLQRQAKNKTGLNALPTRTANNASLTTPKKKAALTLRDGFDDDEMMVLSPSKSPAKSRTGTPKAGEKRKRKPAESSPGQSLQFSQAGGDVIAIASDQSKPRADAIPTPRPAQKSDDRFEYTQKILNHRMGRGERRSFEALADFAFPSESTIMLSTLLLDKITLLSANRNADAFPTALIRILVNLWSRCIKEEYYKPLRLLLDLVKFILLSRSTIGPQVMDEVVELAQSTADINVIPRFKRFTPATTSAPKEEPSEDVDTNECFQILYLIALTCSRRKEHIARFWRLMRFDLIVMVFRSSQPVEDMQIMLKLLGTSVQENSFAMVTNSAVQAESEQHIIGCVSSMLITIPRVLEGEQPYDAVEIAEMRIQILYLVEKLCDKRHSGEAFAKHPFAVGRLVRVMNDELNALYDHKFGHEHRAELVNQATRLLFHLTSAYPEIITMQEKLRVHPGGVYKHLISLTRLAFSDGLFFERGIDDDVVDCAHQMLEDTVTPEEGEALLEVFSTAKK